MTGPVNADAARETLAGLALSLGFDGAAWVGAAVPRAAWERYGAWLSQGRQAGMDYLERGAWRRTDLGTSLPGVRSALVLMVSHSPPPPQRPTGGLRLGRVARYAWTPDYHAQLAPLLGALEREARRLGLTARGYCDTGPVMERELGARAGLGWQGKSGMLVSTGHGALTTLAVLLTTLPPPGGAGEGHPDRCGRCARCVLACPTGAIMDDRTVDARRCVSYLTIEHRGAVPWELRPGLGEWLFGCDVCSEVCPWTTKAGPLARLLQPDPELAYPDLRGFFGVGERQFLRRYGHSAFARARRKGMARNAAYRLGNAGPAAGDDALALLRAALQDPAPEVREAAAWALGRWGRGGEAGALRADPDPQVRAGVTRVLAGEVPLAGAGSIIPA